MPPGSIMANLADLPSAQLDTPTRGLYRQYVDGAWRDYGAREVAELAARWQAAFRRDGLAPGDRVAIGLRNGVAWVALDLAALGAGLVVVPLYVDDNADNQFYCIANSEARLVVVENARLATATARAGLVLPAHHRAKPGQPGQVGFARIDAELFEQRRHLAAMMRLVIEELHDGHPVRQRAPAAVDSARP